MTVQGTYSNRGLRLSYLEAGPTDLAAGAAAGSAPALLLLHGFPFSAAMWEPQVAAFSARCRCLVPDLSGFGESEPTAEVVRMEDFADDTRALLDHTGVERAVVCGLSMGGYVALALAAAAPERLSGLVLASSRAAADTPAAAEGRLASARTVLQEGTGGFAPGFLSKAIGASTAAGQHSRIEALVLAAQPGAVAAAQRGMAERPDRRGLLGEIRVPALILAGEEDTLIPPEESRQMAAAIPGSSLVMIPGAGHLANLEQPEAFNQALARFLDALT
ncbi:MAG TPA: alpha/beta fold hydrolase [Thermoanaerobaculia bacterium]|nr:alpha/beta fold hydrolase [Thermoanaerobaculia bacterium]